MIQSYCKNCGKCNFDSDSLIEYDDIVFLNHNRELGRFFKISATTANCLSLYESNHYDFLSLLINSKYTFNNHDVRKREIFAIRLKHIVGEDDLGEVQCGKYVHYGVVKVKDDNCTLCLACVSACNVGAIIADSQTNSLQINPSICTTCGYCVTTCPENDCISIERDIIKLNPVWFTNSILAQDTLFACVECGKEFATKKAVDKIADMMAPLFKSDPIKERTLYCCENCKPKIMMKSYMENRNNYNNNTIK